MREWKKFWLAPNITVMLLVGTLNMVSQGFALAPFLHIFVLNSVW